MHWSGRLRLSASVADLVGEVGSVVDESESAAVGDLVGRSVGGMVSAR
jgi:hypothetical protein